MRAIFFGTPAIAVPSLEALVEVAEVVGVICQPDRPQGRGLKLQEPPVKQRALELGLDVYQPLKVRDGALRQWLLERQPDVGVVIAYGRILPGDVLSAPRRGCVNLHASLLPRLRGAAPIQWSIIRGDTETGISLMQMDEGLDTGPVYVREPISIGKEDSGQDLADRLGLLAADVVRKYLADVVSETLLATPQDEALATHAPLITAEICKLNFGEPAEVVTNLVRGLSPRPGAFTFIGGKRFKLLRCRPISPRQALAPGEVGVLYGEDVVIGCGGGEAIQILLGQVEGRAAMGPAELLRGRALQPGMVAK